MQLTPPVVQSTQPSFVLNEPRQTTITRYSEREIPGAGYLFLSIDPYKIPPGFRNVLANSGPPLIPRPNAVTVTW
jgi:hypothetical protein